MNSDQHFILGIVCFLIAITICNAVYDKTINQTKFLYRKDADWDRFKTTLPNSNLEYAFMGDSHMLADIDTTSVNNVYNFGTPLEDYSETYYKLNKVYDVDNISINYLVLQLDEYAFANKIRTKALRFRDYKYYNDYVDIVNMSNLTGIPYESLVVYINFNIIAPHNGLSGQIINNYFRPKPVLNGYSNRTGNFSIANNKTKLAKDKVAQFFNESPLVFNDVSFDYFNKIISLANEHNTTIVLLSMPVTDMYYIELETYNFSRQEFYTKVLSQIGNYTLIDNYDIYLDKPEYFDDVDHLNYIGSRLYTGVVLDAIRYT